MSDIQPVGDLIRLAQDFQLECMEKPFDKRIQLVEEALKILGHCAIERNEENAEYVIDTRLSFWKPTEKFAKKQTLVSFGTIAIDGQFSDFSYFSIGAIEKDPINTLCIALGQVRLLPDRDRLPSNDIVYIPVLAVEQALRVA